ncbi:HNH endonuclease signature motif containing protein [Promicromonospora soli]|uniref:HNH endonuclease signature motif containing protein n=1 Tax=Promicromonospora soli TaxID=2035533 RepID=UPI001E530A51|nr:HNH endonuclease signature motif containing protein [Promicromonospora soli]
MQQSTSGMASGGTPRGSLEEALDRIERATGELANLVGPEELGGWDAPGVARLAEAHARIRRLTGRLDGVRYTLLPRIEDDGSWRSGGMSRTFTSWLRLREGVAAATARKDVTTARRLAQALPATRERLVAGVLGADHARVMTEVAPTSATREDALGWLIDTRTGEPTSPELFVQSVAVDFPDPVDDPDGSRTREQFTVVLQDAIAAGTLVTGEGLVLREAGSLNADQFRTVARRFATVTDPDSDDADDDKAAAGEFLDLSRTLGGYHLAGFLTDEHGLLLSTAVNAVMGAPAAEDTRTPAQRRAQGLADVARTVLDGNEASPGAAIPPHLNVTVSWTELVTRTREGLCLTCGQGIPGRAGRTGRAGAGLTGAGPMGGDRTGTPETRTPETGAPETGAPETGTTAGTGTGTPETGTTAGTRTGTGTAGSGGTRTGLGLLSAGGAVFTETGGRAPRASLRRLACDCAVTRIVFGADGAVLDVGRAQRTVTGQMRRAVIARDQHCVYPGCDQPPSRCEVHHAVTHWANGGQTSVANSALLCWHHHQLVDAQDITMRWTGKPARIDTAGVLLQTGWAFTDARGHSIRLPDVIEATPVSGTGPPDPSVQPPVEPPAAAA